MAVKKKAPAKKTDGRSVKTPEHRRKVSEAMKKHHAKLRKQGRTHKGGTIAAKGKKPVAKAGVVIKTGPKATKNKSGAHGNPKKVNGKAPVKAKTAPVKKLKPATKPTKARTSPNTNKPNKSGTNGNPSLKAKAVPSKVGKPTTAKAPTAKASKVASKASAKSPKAAPARKTAKRKGK